MVVSFLRYCVNRKGGKLHPRLGYSLPPWFGGSAASPDFAPIGATSRLQDRTYHACVVSDCQKTSNDAGFLV